MIPFVTETMYRNLTETASGASNGPGNPPSVHHCDYPTPNESLIDTQLSQDMEALLRLVSLGSAARNTVKIKVRQPLAELAIQAGSVAEQSAVIRFADQIRDELNLKKVALVLHGPLLKFEVKLNMRAPAQAGRRG